MLAKIKALLAALLIALLVPVVLGLVLIVAWYAWLAMAAIFVVVLTAVVFVGAFQMVLKGIPSIPKRR